MTEAVHKRRNPQQEASLYQSLRHAVVRATSKDELAGLVAHIGRVRQAQGLTVQQAQELRAVAGRVGQFRPRPVFRAMPNPSADKWVWVTDEAGHPIQKSDL